MQNLNTCIPTNAVCSDKYRTQSSFTQVSELIKIPKMRVKNYICYWTKEENTSWNQYIQNIVSTPSVVYIIIFWWWNIWRFQRRIWYIYIYYEYNYDKYDIQGWYIIHSVCLKYIVPIVSCHHFLHNLSCCISVQISLPLRPERKN